MLSRLARRHFGTDVTTPSGRALVEEHYWSLRRQAPIVYLLGIVNLSAMEIAATGTLSPGFNVPTFIAACGVIRTWQWYGADRGSAPTHEIMMKRLRQTVWFAAAICITVCARCLYLLQVGDAASDMAVMLFGGLTAIGVAYGLTALPIAGWMPLLLIIGPMSIVGFMSEDRRFAGAAFGLVVVAVLTLRLLGAHSRHFTTVIRSRSVIAREQELVEQARQEAIVAATTDFLTGLPNRRALVAALDTAASEGIEPFALAILDLDRFKAVNDTFGHAIGDQLLKEVAARLVNTVGRRGLVARLGGDEFGILLPGARSAREAQAIGSLIVSRVNGPACLDGREFTIAASCGIGLSRKCEDSSPSRLMADADLALYQAKENPGSGAAIFELSMEAPRRRRAQIERALQLPGVRDQLRVMFQPIFDLKTGRIIANEALARWSSPELGAIAPSEFVPIAEQLNLIDEINRQLMSLAFEAAHSWPQEIKLSFNLSAIQLCSAGAAKSVLAALKLAGLAAGRLQVEVTETALLADFDRARSNLTELRKAGATIVLDDFGAGYASIGYLRELRFDQIKLDGALVTAAQHSRDGKRLLRAVIGLCEILGVSTVAEHVESKDLLSLVMELGCTAGQGFWLERPLEPQDVLHLCGSKVIPLPARNRHAA
ncbi:MAG: putative bifunctional diguanylate cyclase/phosphodiesterase [Sphingomicrobium sp.]